MPDSILSDKKAPYCPGCGHNLVTNNIARALQRMEISPLDVVVVSDIGCCGLVDGILTCHTVHGLHGRSTALAMGITMGLNNPNKKVIAIQGDGGATIGLQHLLEASRQNVDMTLIIQNNMVYGMTGGQVSGLTPMEFREMKMPDSGDIPPYDICELAHHAGAAYSARHFVQGDFSEIFIEAFGTPGFSLVEIIEMCPAHGIRKIKELHRIFKYPEITLKNERTPQQIRRRDLAPLLRDLPEIEKNFAANLQGRLSVIIAGSAGEGIQVAGELLAQAGIAAGLHTTKKGEYPITVGTGFSIAGVILSREVIYYTGIESPEVLIVTSGDGYQKVKHYINNKTDLIMDASLEVPAGSRVVWGDFRKVAGPKGAALAAIAFWLKRSNLLPIEALIEAAERYKYRDRLLSSIEKGSSASMKKREP